MTYETNEIAQLTAEFVNTTDRNVFLTGKAGTGKTTFLKQIIQSTPKKTVVAAPTGIAAINANGVTLHSLLQLPFGAFIPDRMAPPHINGQVTTLFNLFSGLRFNSSKRQLIREMELLIIDEVSMLRADLLDCIDHMLRYLRRNKDTVFGGVQILFIGDLLQLPPVVKEEEWNLLKGHYASSYFFEAKALAQEPLIHLELEKVYRQTDEVFINVLNRFRENRQTEEDRALLNQHYKSEQEIEQLDGFIHLTTHNRKADAINSKKLDQLQSKSFEFKAEISGDFNENAFPVNQNLLLKKGAQVMFIKNDPSGQGLFFNGKIGKVCHLSSDQIKVAFESGEEVTVPQYLWENKRFTLNKDTKEIDEKVLGSFSHFPLKLAWSVTVHKSQGLTFERAILDLTDSFTQGQTYVALSRLTSLNGLVLSSKIPSSGFEISSTMEAFIAQKPAFEKLNARLANDRKTYLQQLIQKHFDFQEITRSLNGHINSFDKQENRSLKQQYLDWTIEMAKPILALTPIGKSFHGQTQKIIFQEDHLRLLSERVEKAKVYFSEILKVGLEKLSEQERKLKKSTQLKTYRGELKDLKELVFGKLLSINRAALTIEFISQGKVPSKNDIDSVLQELIIPKIKKDKTPTHEVSLDLYEKGKSIDEIAAERGLAQSTIEGHLCKYVVTGEVKAVELIEAQKLKNILTLIGPETTGIGEIKSKLGDEYTYGDVKVAMAEYERTNHSN